MASTMCLALAQTLDKLVPPFRDLLNHISQDVLNRKPADHKMSIGQIALHTFGYMRLYMTGDGPAPFERTAMTAVPASYPLEPYFVLEQIDLGQAKMQQVLASADDAKLEQAWPMPGGKVVKLGYIVSRLLHHIMIHGVQIAYLRHMYEPGWKSRGWGEWVTPLIALPYHTSESLTQPSADRP